MERASLPSHIRGNWIWSKRQLGTPDSYVFFRRAFTLDEIPSVADLWVAARSFCHLYVNGNHVSYGLNTCPNQGSYVWYVDIQYLLETGENTIAILAHNTTVARTSCRKQPSGLWCQLDVDNHPLLSTDKSWRFFNADCYVRNRPRRSLSTGFAEKLDCREYPKGWLTPAYNDDQWHTPDYCVPVKQENWTLAPHRMPHMTITSVPFQARVVKGSCRKAHASTCVSFAKLTAERGGGVYAAETFLYMQEAREVDAEIYVDSPFRLFLNGVGVKEQGVVQLDAGAVYTRAKGRCFRGGDTEDPDLRLALQEGWNRLLFFAEMAPGSAGMTLLALGTGPDSLHFVRAPHQESMPGWSVDGPLKTPLANTLGHMSLNEDRKEYYIPVEDRPVDDAAELMSYDFTPSDETHERLDENSTLDMAQGEYAILELDACSFGCPTLTLHGSEDDVVELVWAEDIVDGQLMPWQDEREYVDTVVLAADESEFMACTPRGLRYLMIVVKHADNKVTIRHPALDVRQYQFENPGRFESADDVLNHIWATGRRTLQSTLQESFLDSPCDEETQYIADAMIQSWAGYHLFGCFELAANSIKDFAAAQFETGEIIAACPSDMYLNIPDYALLWPVWLLRHYQYTGDEQLVERLLPNLQALLAHYAHLALPERAVLGDLGRRFGAYCFLDHGAIDREGVVTGLNALYCRALLSAAPLFAAANDNQQAQACRDRAARLAHDMQELTWNEKRGLFADAWQDGDLSDSYTMQTNVLAIYGGLAHENTYDSIFDTFFQDAPPFAKDAPSDTDNPYFKYFILETAFALGRRKWGLSLLRWYWNAMLEKGARTWWELFNPQSEESGPQAGICHGYGTSPNGFLISEVAGLRPAKPGFTTAYFNPLVESVQSVQARIPTTYGEILVEWEFKDGKLEAALDASYPVSIIPELEKEVAETATMHVSDEVSIFASE